MPDWSVRPARASDLGFLAAVERSAARAFAAAPGPALPDVTVPSDLLTEMAARENLWVAVDGHDEPVGFVGCQPMGIMFYVHELSVGLDWQRQGVGRRLMRAVLQAAQDRRYQAVGLTTRRDVRWNKPFYQSLGFSEIEAGQLADLSRQLRDEIKDGADPGTRCAMAFPFPAAQ